MENDLEEHCEALISEIRKYPGASDGAKQDAVNAVYVLRRAPGISGATVDLLKARKDQLRTALDSMVLGAGDDWWMPEVKPLRDAYNDVVAAVFRAVRA